jgi:hypothetical protein
VAVGDRVEKFRTLAAQAFRDLFNQKEPFGRLALVQTLMLAGDTLVAISLAGTLFFSISPTQAKSKVLLYLVLTLAPFAVVSPLLGPIIDRSRGARRAMVVFSAVGRAVICPFMATSTHSLLLFPEAFLILVLSKLYLVTRGALVPEMASLTAPGRPSEPPAAPGAPAVSGEHPLPLSWPTEALGAEAQSPAPGPNVEYAALNARLTLLGTLAGFAAAVPGVALYKLAGSPAVLIFDTVVFSAAALAGARLPVRHRRHTGPPAAPAAQDPTVRGATTSGTDDPDRWGPAETDPDLASLQSFAHPEVLLGLSAMSLIRGLAGFLVFLLAFGLRRGHAALYWYGLALGASGVGAIVGLLLVAQLRRRLIEQQILLVAIWLIAAGGLIAALWGWLLAQVFLALVVGVAGSLAQPSFDALTQRFVPVAAQGRAFARFSTRQQLVWVLAALIPVVVTMPFKAGDVLMATVAGVGGIFYLTSRRALRDRALPRQHEGSG